MKGATRIALVAVLCWLGLAQAYITWGPRCYLSAHLGIPDSELAMRVGANNTWSITGEGDKVEVAFVADSGGHRGVWFTRSEDRGQHWDTAVRLSFPRTQEDSAGEPSLVRADLDTGKVLAVAFISWTHVTGHTDSVIGKVWCRASGNRGGYWNGYFEATYVPGPTSRPHACHLTAACAPGVPNVRWLEVVWEEPYGANAESICSRTCHVHEDGVSPENSAYLGIVNTGLGNAGAPSVCNANPSHDADCAWRSGAGWEGITVNSKLGGGWQWDTPGNDPVWVHDPYYNHGFPSIACLDTAHGNSANSVPSHDLVASDATREPSSTQRGLVLSFRDWWLDSTPPRPSPFYTSLWYDDSGRLANDELLRPSVYGTNGVERSGEQHRWGDTFYMAFTATRNVTDNLRDILYTSIYQHNHDGIWRFDYPRVLGISGDSACICVQGDEAYALFSSRPLYQYHAGIAVRVGIVNFHRLTVPVEEFAAGSNGGRCLARVPGSSIVHRTHIVDNFINYERSTDNGATWDYQDAPGFGTNPSLALGPSGEPWITYVRDDTVFCAVLDADSEWTIRTVFAPVSGQHVGPPSLGVFPNGSTRIGNVVFPCYDTVTASSMILYCQFDTASGVYSLMLDTLDYCNGKYTDSSACLVVGLTDTITTCYGRGDSVYERKLVYAPNSMCRPDPWTSASLIDSDAVVTSSHPSVEKIGSRLCVAFTQRSISGNDTTWAIKQASCSLLTAGVVWEGLTTVSAADSKHKDFPSVSTSRVVTWAESSAGHWLIKAKVGDSLMTLTSPDSDSKFCSVLADTAVHSGPSTNMTRIRWLWSQRYLADTWQVKYSTMDVNASNADANVTMYNQGRKLALDHNDSLSSVFRTLQGSIYYAHKKDGVEGWTSSLLRNKGDMPCVDDDYLNRVWVADRDFTNPTGGATTYDNIYCQTRPAGSSTWTSFQVYSSQLPAGGTGAPVHKIGPPAIVACLNDTAAGQNRTAAYIVFTVYEPGGMNARATTCMAKVSTSGVVYVDTLRWVSGWGDSFPSIALHKVGGQGYGLDVAWQLGTEVYVKKTTNQDQPQFTTKRTWSSNYNLSNTASWSRHPQVAADTDTVMVAWVEGDSGRILTKRQASAAAYNSWGDTVNVSNCPDTVCDYPSIALSHGDSTIVEYQKKLSSTNYDIMARVNFHSNLNISNSSTNSKYPHCIIHFHEDSIPVISTVWTEELSTNYAEVGYKRWQLGQSGGGGIQSTSIFDPSISPTLFAPVPNPFARTTTIRYQTNIQGRTSVAIHDVTGRKVCNLMTTYQRPGIYNVTWTGRDDRQRQLPEGIYFVRLQTSNYCEARKLILTQ